MLEKFESLCEERQKIIVSKDKGSRVEHRANNIEQCRVRHYQIDGVVITDLNKSKCDFLLTNDDRKKVYFIELKGTDVKKSIEQLEETERILGNEFPDYERYFRIVYKANTHGIRSTAISKFKIRKKGRVIAATDRYEEDI